MLNIVFLFLHFQQFLDIDVTLPADKVAEITDGLFAKLNSILAKLKSVLLVENVLESIKVSLEDEDELLYEISEG